MRPGRSPSWTASSFATPSLRSKSAIVQPVSLTCWRRISGKHRRFDMALSRAYCSASAMISSAPARSMPMDSPSVPINCMAIIGPSPDESFTGHGQVVHAVGLIAPPCTPAVIQCSTAGPTKRQPLLYVLLVLGRELPPPWLVIDPKVEIGPDQFRPVTDIAGAIIGYTDAADNDP